MKEDKYEPDYICWYEREFWADRSVIRMTWLQRHLYRTLLQAAFYTSTRPYLPNDDELLVELADAESLKMWMENKEVVLRKFFVVEKNGISLLGHKRLLRDWELHLAHREQARRAGKVSANKRSLNTRSMGADKYATQAEQAVESRPTNKTETETETETKTKLKQKEKETETGTETETGDGAANGISSGVFQPHSVISGKSAVAVSVSGIGPGAQKRAAQELASFWDTYESDVRSPADSRPFERLLMEGYEEIRIKEVLGWSLSKSNYFQKTNKERTPDNFARSFSTLTSQYDSYLNSVKSKQKGSRSDSSSEAPASETVADPVGNNDWLATENYAVDETEDFS